MVVCLSHSLILNEWSDVTHKCLVKGFGVGHEYNYNSVALVCERPPIVGEGVVWSARQIPMAII
jgi:hypothetical protein